MMLKKMCKPRGVAGALYINKGQNLIIERRVSAEKMRKKTNEYQYFVFENIFSERNLKKCINGIKNIIQKNGESDEEIFGKEFTENKNSWFYISGKNLYYFLEENNDNKKDIKDEDSTKKQSCLNLGNSEDIEPKCESEENKLIDQYDEEIVLLQIPQEDTKVEDVMGKFENVNKAADTIVVLKEKEKVMVGIIDGQSYIRRLSSTPQIKDPDVNRSRLNTWTCGMCGKKFQAQNPYQDNSGHAICEDCWKKVTDT